MLDIFRRCAMVEPHLGINCEVGVKDRLHSVIAIV